MKKKYVGLEINCRISSIILLHRKMILKKKKTMRDRIRKGYHMYAIRNINFGERETTEKHKKLKKKL